jgi:phosphate starvation-inducible protein PhoH and related proteins
VQLNIHIEQPGKKLALFGPGDRTLRTLREAFGITLVARDDQLRMTGEGPAITKAAAAISELQRRLRRQDHLTSADLSEALTVAAKTEAAEREGSIEVYARGHAVRPKTAGQQAYADAMFKHDLTICSGPAGTGKTYLAVAAAAALLKRGDAKRIVLARPAVEAGEKLGFLPGDLQAKVNPYLRPLFDALHDMMDFDQVKRFMLNDVIEVVPLAFMRGRTLNEAVIILDEAQNTTPSQMLMFLTRLGQQSKMIITGDVSQVDLPPDQPSGLVDAMQRLYGIPGVALVRLGRSDIVRHPLVQNIVNAYGHTD